MAKGFEKHQERMEQLRALGKGLARRSGAKCELCGTSGEPLQAYEVPPAPAEPELERCVFVCATCLGELENPKRLDANHWRRASQAVWSETPAAQVVAARALDRLSKTEMWAREALESVYFDEEVERWIAEQAL